MVDYHRHGGQQQHQHRFRQPNFQRDDQTSRKTMRHAMTTTTVPSKSSASVSPPPLPARRRGTVGRSAASPPDHRHNYRNRDDAAAQRRPSGERVVLWPRGGFLFATDALSRAYNDAEPRHAGPPTVDLALQFAYAHFFTHQTRRVRWPQFLSAVSGDGGGVTICQWNGAFAYAVFGVARSMTAGGGASSTSEAADASADLLPLCAVIAFLGCKRHASRDAVNFVRQNIDKLCWLLLLANYDFARMTICTQRFRDDYLPPHESGVRVPLDAVENLDLLFEGTILGGGGGSAAAAASGRHGTVVNAAVVASSVVPQYLSTILQAILQRKKEKEHTHIGNVAFRADDLPKTIEWDRLLRLLACSVQTDMFLLDVVDADDGLAPMLNGTIGNVRPARRNDVSGEDVDLYDCVTNESGQNQAKSAKETVRAGGGETLKRFSTASSSPCDDCRRNAAASSTAVSRTITSTQLAEHRKITLRRWAHTEILTNPVYRAANLRVFIDNDRDVGKSRGAVFHPKLLKTAAIVGECFSSSSSASASCHPSRKLEILASTGGPRPPPPTTRIVLGPVSGQLLLRNVRDAAVSAVARRVCVVDCCRLTLFLNTASPVLVVGSRNADIRVAPYNVFYEGLAHELAAAEMDLLSDERNAWRQVVRVDDVFAARKRGSRVAIQVNDSAVIADDDGDGGGGRVVKSVADDEAVDDSIVVRRLSVHEFHLQPTPFQSKIIGKNDFYEEVFLRSIPGEYWRAWTARVRAARRHLNALSGAQRDELLRRAGVDTRYLLKRVQRKK